MIKNKRPDSLLHNFINKLSDEDLRLLYSRLSQAFAGDVAEALYYLSGYLDMDRWLQSAHNSEEFYDMLDQIEYFMGKELEKRDNLQPSR